MEVETEAGDRRTMGGSVTVIVTMTQLLLSVRVRELHMVSLVKRGVKSASCLQ